jgi:hypothetical protein
MTKHIILIFFILFASIGLSQDSSNFEQRYELIQKNVPSNDSIPNFLLECGASCGLSEILFSAPNTSYDKFSKMFDSDDGRIEIQLEQLEIELEYLTLIVNSKIDMDTRQLSSVYNELRLEFTATFERMKKRVELKAIAEDMLLDTSSASLVNMLDLKYKRFRKSNEMTDDDFIAFLLTARLSINITSEILNAFETLDSKLNTSKALSDIVDTTANHFNFSKIEPLAFGLNYNFSNRDSVLINFRIAMASEDDLFDFKILVNSKETPSSDTIFVNDQAYLRISPQLLEANHSFALQSGDYNVTIFYKPHSNTEVPWGEMQIPYSIE